MELFHTDVMSTLIRSYMEWMTRMYVFHCSLLLAMGSLAEDSYQVKETRRSQNETVTETGAQ